MKNTYDVIIIGGSYSGLSAAMALGRTLRSVLIIDSGKPCNRFTPHSHNFITHDGAVPGDISAKAKEQVLTYPTVEFITDTATDAVKTGGGFMVTAASGTTYTAKKLLVATGVVDMMPDIKGFSECWAKSVVHCPYCHGYEIRGKKTAILANGDAAYHYALLVSQLTDGLSIYTNGKAEFTKEQLEKFGKNNIPVNEANIAELEHTDGYVTHIVFEDGSRQSIDAIYSKPVNVQHTDIPEKLGCTINESGLIVVDETQRTNVAGVYASGDCTNGQRAVAIAVASGMKAGALINAELAAEVF
ncbi:NAD(P)/FAD-dependent oxidoreductase [Flavobacterium sp. MFBS3-15]|uniref:NAD(P)/FAD-dependent oxidoreductase n=1 Tax=Flavobacterium sp. MFBS3-15 TaxID=2989816 RepID=UPI002236495E|nr:NAD(P)/FAD-dependent oxidoreductase [Flavobacterium sp. MFBS3-15]MCW4468497.1 NAD(P)/FAD-dependent oxidoreductase [Flavobacterium sp. MFBS3-15]